jgi:hypothetical protein
MAKPAASSDLTREKLTGVRHLGLKTARQVLNLLGQYYPANRIPVKAQYLVEGLFEESQI